MSWYHIPLLIEDCKTQYINTTWYHFVCSFFAWWRHQMEHFPRYWPSVRGIHRSPVNSSHKGQWRGPLIFSLMCAWIDGWVNNCEAGDSKRHHTRYDVTLMVYQPLDETCKLLFWTHVSLPRWWTKYFSWGKSSVPYQDAILFIIPMTK